MHAELTADEVAAFELHNALAAALGLPEDTEEEWRAEEQLKARLREAHPTASDAVVSLVANMRRGGCAGSDGELVDQALRAEKAATEEPGPRITWRMRRKQDRMQRAYGPCSRSVVRCPLERLRPRCGFGSPRPFGRRWRRHGCGSRRRWPGSRAVSEPPGRSSRDRRHARSRPRRRRAGRLENRMILLQNLI
jgi:hypothetical protein